MTYNTKTLLPLTVNEYASHSTTFVRPSFVALLVQRNAESATKKRKRRIVKEAVRYNCCAAY
jgi:hypothetical protein